MPALLADQTENEGGGRETKGTRQRMHFIPVAMHRPEDPGSGQTGQTGQNPGSQARKASQEMVSDRR